MSVADAERTHVAKLALEGGPAVRNEPIAAWPRFDEDDRTAANDVLLSGRVNYWTGEQGHNFEREFAAWAGAPYAVALANGTVALEVALRSIGLRLGDEVVVPAATFIATASAVVACGGRPVVVDVDRKSQCLTAETIEPAITRNTRAVIVVHLGGHPADMAPILDLARHRGLHVIEDCAQAHGARQDGHGVGTFGDIAAWSFCQDKIMTTAGEGGAITTANEELWRKCWAIKDHGKSYSAVYEREHPRGFRWLHETFGTNARMTEVQAAVGRSQLRKLDDWVHTRQTNASFLHRALSQIPALRIPWPPAGSEHAFYRFYAHVRPDHLSAGWNRDRVVSAICSEGIPCSSGGCMEIYKERAFDSIGRPPAPLTVASELARTSFVLPVYPTLDQTDMSSIALTVNKVLEWAAK